LFEISMLPFSRPSSAQATPSNDATYLAVQPGAKPLSTMSSSLLASVHAQMSSSSSVQSPVPSSVTRTLSPSPVPIPLVSPLLNPPTMVPYSSHSHQSLMNPQSTLIPSPPSIQIESSLTLVQQVRLTGEQVEGLYLPLV
jgi:hypothetical protein